MSLENVLPDYAEMTQALQQQGVGLTTAEMHGLMSGLLCGGHQDDSWMTLIHDLTCEGQVFSPQLSQPLKGVYQHSRAALEENSFRFQLMLPDEQNHDVFIRAEALSGWVNHFLLGIGMMQPQLGQMKGDVGEVIDDLRSIAQLGCDEEDSPEDLSQSLEEVVEYVRMAAILCHSEFTQDLSAIPATPKMTLH